MGARMRESSTTDDYRAALSGEGDFGSLGYDWSDKPHRLVYDLCGEVDLLRSRIAELEAALRSMVKDCGDGAVRFEAGRLAMREAVRVLTKPDA